MSDEIKIERDESTLAGSGGYSSDKHELGRVSERIEWEENERLRFKRDAIIRLLRRVRGRVVLGTIIVFLGVLLFFSSDFWVGLFSSNRPNFNTDAYNQFNNAIKAAAVIIVFSGVAQFFLLNYLESGLFFPQLKDLDLPSTVERRTIASQTSLEGARGTPSSIDERESPLERQLFSATSRLYREIADLGRRGNTNLFIGIITTIVGVCILIYVVYTSTGDTDFGWKSGIHTILRISIAIFVQTFAYFFLRLYKTSLDDIKYYQNEITNIESKWLALNAVIEDKDKALLKIVVDSLSKTERNFILKKGDSTLGLERERLEKNEVIELVKEALGTASKIKTGK
jgi:hypothetical protein